MLQDLRKDYALGGLLEEELEADPFSQFRLWFQQAQEAKGHEPNAMTVATCGADGEPAARTVLLKALDHGFIFYTNYESGKGSDLAENPRAELLFFWPEVERQVRIHGTVERLTREESAAYFHSRPRGNQLGAAVSPQSRVVPSRQALEEQFAALDASIGDGEVPLPDYWGGYRVIPTWVEFWQGRRSRLHDRLRFVRADDGWRVERLAP
jgi:pyridoxamine 5'-phosphate oxidase